MKKNKSTLKVFTRSAIACLAMAGTTFAYAQQTSGTNELYVPGELLVKYKSNTGTQDKEVTRLLHGVEHIETFKNPKNNAPSSLSQTSADLSSWEHVRANGDVDLAALRAQLTLDSTVERVEYNYFVNANLVPNDPRFGELWGMDNLGQTGGVSNADVDAPEAWDIQTGSADVVVGVIDTGIDYSHPDLQANMWTNPGEIPANGIDDDGNGYVDDVHGYDFVNNDGDPMDDHGHGTHVAGTIAAVGDNGIGVAGVSWNAQLMGIKFLSASGSGTTANAIAAVTYATDMGVNITNNSWGGGGFSQALEDAISAAAAANSLFVAAAGNSNNDNDQGAHYPSTYDVSNIVAVAATEINDQRASFSSYGETSVDLGAPGVSILSTVPSTGSLGDPSGYRLLNGTSMATPHVAGAAALILGRYPELTHQELKNRLLLSSRKIPSMTGITVSGGVLNVAQALQDDELAPNPVSDLSLVVANSRTADIAWTSTGDDEGVGFASVYEIFYSTEAIDASNIEDANTQLYFANGTSTETATINGLVDGTTYYAAIIAVDDVGNVSELSNVVEFTTLPSMSVYENSLDSISDWDLDGTVGPEGLLWHLSTHRITSPTTALYYGIESTLNYDTGSSNYGTATTPEIDLSGVGDAILTFEHFLATENLPPFDTASVLVSADGGVTWSEVFSTANSTGSMVEELIDISEYAGQTIRLRFSFDTLDSILNQFEGWVIDDIEISGAPLTPVPVISSPVSVALGEAILFDASGSQGSPTSYTWYFGDGTTVETTEPTISHVYPVGGQYTVLLMVSNDNGVSEDPATASVNVIASYVGGFDGSPVGSDPEGWLDTDTPLNEPPYNAEPDDSLFSVVELAGENVFSTSSTTENIHSHYVGSQPFGISAGYEYSGRMLITEGTSHIGVTFFSQLPGENGYYMLRSLGGYNGFHLAAQGSLIEGDVQSFVSPGSIGNGWARFRIQVEDVNGRTEIRANVWADGSAEPSGWQMDAYDQEEWRFTEGTFGVWSGGTGTKYWDDLEVSSLGELPAVVSVPDVNALSEAEATAHLLEESGLSVWFVDYRYDNNVPAGQAIETNPGSGALLYEGDSVELVVSLGQLFWFEVPSLIGLGQLEAEVELIAAGFTLGAINETSSPEAVGTVIGQSVSGGSWMPEGTAIDITVSTGPAT